MTRPLPPRRYAAEARALEPFASPPGWLGSVLAPEQLAAALLAAVPTLATGGTRLEEASTERVRVKKGRWLVRCAATVRDADGAVRDVALAGELLPSGLSPSPDTNEGPKTDEVPDANDGATEGGTQRGRPPLSPGDRLWLPGLRLDLTVTEPDAPDPDLPAAAVLADPERAAGLLEQALRDRHYPQVRIASVEPWVLRSKPGSRCTMGYQVDYRSQLPGQPERLVAKAYADDTGARTHAVMTALEEAAGRPAYLAEPLGYLPEEQVLLQGWVEADRTVKDVAREAFVTGDAGLADELRTTLARCAEALASLHGSGASYGDLTRFADELDAARGEIAEAAATVSGLADWTTPLVQALARSDTRLPTGAPVPSHGAYRPAQVLVGASVWLVDLDAAGMAEAAMDLGTFCAGLDSLGVSDLDPAAPAGVLQARLRLLDECDELFLARYGQLAPVDVPRVHLWQSLDLLESVLHSWTHGRPDRAGSRCALLVHHLGRADTGGRGVIRRSRRAPRAGRLTPSRPPACPPRCAPRSAPRPRRGSG